MKYVSALLTVRDMAKSRDFYARILGRSVTADYGPNVEFDKAFSLHLREHFCGVLGRGAERGRNDVELYFEDEDLPALESRLRDAGVEFIHGAVEQQWRQVAMRFLDPDGYIIEVGEPLPAMIARLSRQGLAPPEIARATGLGEDFVRASI